MPAYFSGAWWPYLVLWDPTLIQHILMPPQIITRKSLTTDHFYVWTTNFINNYHWTAFRLPPSFRGSYFWVSPLSSYLSYLTPDANVRMLFWFTTSSGWTRGGWQVPLGSTFLCLPCWVYVLFSITNVSTSWLLLVTIWVYQGYSLLILSILGDSCYLSGSKECYLGILKHLMLISVLIIHCIFVLVPGNCDTISSPEEGRWGPSGYSTWDEPVA